MMIRQSLGAVMVGALIGGAAMSRYGHRRPGTGQAVLQGRRDADWSLFARRRHGGTVYLSGQIGLDPASGQIVEGGTEAQTKRVDGEPGRGAEGGRPRLRLTS